MDALGYSGAYMMELYRQNYDEFARLRESVDRLQDIADSRYQIKKSLLIYQEV